MISFANASDSVKIRLSCSKVLLLINFIADCEMLLKIHSDGCTKGDKYLFFIKVDAANVLLKLDLDTIQKDYIYHTKQYQTFCRKM